MWSKYYVLLGGFLLINAVGKFQCYGALDKQFPLGTIGCLFTDPEKLCGADVTCIDDLLFGTCPTAGVPDNFVYTLNEHDMKKLWQELDKLVIAGYKWSDGYTQCITQNVILSLTIQEPFSKKLCNQHIFDWEKDVKDEITSTLGKLYKRTMDFNQLTSEQSPMDELPLLTANSQKRDEIVRVHKYFDKSKGIIKRKSNYLTYDPQDDLYGFNQGLYAQNYVDPSANEYRDTSIDLPWDDLLLVKSYLEEMQGKEQQRHRTKLSDLLALGSRQPEPEDGLYGLYPGSAYDIEPSVGSDVEPEIMNQEPGYLWSNEGSELYNLPPSTEEEALETMDLPEDPLSEELGSVVESSTEDLINSLPPQYANTLDKLIKGELVPENLTDDELDYLMPYVTKMLLRLSEEIQEGETTQDPLEATVEKALEMDMEAQDERIPFGVEEEDMEMGGRDSGLTDGAADRDQAVEEEDMGDMMEKKSAADDVNEAVAEEEKNEDVVDTNYAFVEMDQPLTEEKADQLVEALQKIVSANPNSLNNYLVQGKKVYIDVDPMRAGFNASVVAQQATDHKVDLEAATGLKFVTSGIGHENEVPIKSTENRYFELTFVLCGCIAGILLAVVVVYLIRRNSRSKEKLKQIAASNQDGNEAASKDYQDLCRQRMQSKSSEKPEPLHAASRVGSVSESQVRSPSSRSSTSSCKMDLKYKKRSEEPVNSNMDISTGHIVLSYMEDHLKNKDRLEREWDAMCAYEADPASTKMAQDPANTRKNRYGDVLPYDHSRVVLSNVSGSDYINASTITDHDPRNPAYIATQGPQPHTVAEFWQMVWEQGSVVIVMLTKLTETGEAKCHRYWPEEGSDLYHIYEVHLVSEHIWCDDYLVRSFYLKNLQTSETRTVTQFHFLTWPDLGVPSSIKALLDFRRKVNKSYRGRSCPIVVHCSDGCGRTGTYTLVDMVLNRMAKGAKEIDIAATLEHIRDQRMNMVKTKEQFQFALAAVAEEVHAILKALPQ